MMSSLSRERQTSSMSVVLPAASGATWLAVVEQVVCLSWHVMLACTDSTSSVRPSTNTHASTQSTITVWEHDLVTPGWTRRHVTSSSACLFTHQFSRSFCSSVDTVLTPSQRWRPFSCWWWRWRVVWCMASCSLHSLTSSSCCTLNVKWRCICASLSTNRHSVYAHSHCTYQVSSLTR